MSVPTSSDLIAMAEEQWQNKEERKGLHEKRSWMTGWIEGYLAPKKRFRRGRQTVRRTGRYEPTTMEKAKRV